MPFQIKRVQVWSGEMPDRPGAAAAKLELLARSGADLEFVFTRPDRKDPTGSIIFMAPISGADQEQAARHAGLTPASDIAMLSVEGDNRGGIGFEIMSRLAVANINLRGLSVSAMGKRFISYLAFDNADVATLALQVLVTMDS